MAVLGAGAAIDLIVTLLVSFGPPVFSFGITGTNLAIQIGAVPGFTVWSLVAAAVLF